MYSLHLRGTFNFSRQVAAVYICDGQDPVSQPEHRCFSVTSIHSSRVYVVEREVHSCVYYIAAHFYQCRLILILILLALIFF